MTRWPDYNLDLFLSLSCSELGNGLEAALWLVLGVGVGVDLAYLGSQERRDRDTGWSDAPEDGSLVVLFCMRRPFLPPSSLREGT